MADHKTSRIDRSDRPQTHRRQLIPAVVALVAAVALIAGAPSSWGWTAKEEVKDGVVHVMNPATSKSKPIEVELEEEWRIGGEDDEEIFGVITAIVADAEGNFYLLDAQLNEIKVYDNDGEYVRTIGREGEGPGEFRGAFNMFLVPGGNIGVLQTFPGKVVTLTPTGDPADEFPLPEVDGGGFRILLGAQYAGKNLALVYALNQPSETGFTQENILALVEPDGKTEHQLNSQASTMKAAAPVIAEKEWDTFRNGRWAASSDGRAFAAVSFGKYEIDVWDSSGKLQRVIHREYPDHMRSQEEIDRILAIYEGFTRRQIPLPDLKYEIEEKYNQIGGIFARDDGSLWVQTSRGRAGLDEGIVGIFDVFDKKGQFVQQITLKGEGDPENDGYFFVKDRLFVVTDFLAAMMALQGGGGDAEDAEDEPELMQIISYKVKTPGIGG
jgi:hypothetical protein